MKVDLREKMKTKQVHRELPANHRGLFEDKLDRALHQEPAKRPWAGLRVAASIVLLFALGYWGFQKMSGPGLPQVNTAEPAAQQAVSLEQYSPELKKIENYYLTAISIELASLEIDDENRAIFDAYFRKLEKLSKQYEGLNAQLTLDRIDEQLINALIDNLQQRLNLMIELKNEIKKQKATGHEQNSI